jgi:hypothetical protein
MDEQIKPEKFFFLKSGESVTTAGLVRKLKGSIFEITQEPVNNDEDTAIGALAGFDASENLTGTMTPEEIETFIDEFCTAWEQDTP